jgi:pilus assembly protein Flp/PilA
MIIGLSMTRQDVSMIKPVSMRSFCDFIRDDSGATAIEYAIIASGIAGAIIIAVMSLGSTLQTKYQGVSTALN